MNKRRVWPILILALALVPLHRQAQLDAQSLKLLPQGQTADWVLDAPIDPRDYRLGPGDVVGHMAYNLDNTRGEGLVDTDGCLELPGLGRVRVAELSLQDARTRFGKRLARIFNCDSVNVWVAKPRRIQVTVSGADLVPRWLVLLYTTRLSAVVDTAVSRDKHETPEDRLLSWRNVQVLRGDSVLSVDLLRHLRTGDVAQNPVLESGDRIVWSFRNTVLYAYGLFRQKADWVEFRQGDTPEDIIRILGGPRVGLSGVHYELVRFTDKGAVEKRWTFSAEAPECQSLKLQPNDRLYLRCDNATDMANEVVIQGRVTQPGRYAIEAGHSTLADLLAWARPDSQTAALTSIKITRRPEIDQELLFAERNIEGTELTRFEREYLKARTLQEGGRVSVVYQAGDLDASHFVLADGDEVRVLRRSDDVEVLGAVKHPGVQAWVDGWTVRDYLKAAGGKLRGARLSELRLRRVGEDQFSPVNLGTELDAGDALMLMPREEMTAWEKFKEGMSVASQILTVVLVARSI